MSFSEQIVQLGGREARLMRGGSGEPLVFLHGGEGSMSRMTSFLAPLTRDFDVMAPLHPGFGGTPLPPDFDSVDDLVLHYLDLFDKLKLARVHLVGLSLGGWIAAELAALHRERVSKMVLVDAAGIKVEGIILPNPFMISGEKLAAMLVSDPALRASLAPKTPEERVARLLDREAAARFVFQRLYDPKLKARLARVTAPTLVLWGEKDGLMPLDYGRAYAKAIPGARFSTLDAGHALPLERPAEFAAAVASFLKEGK